MPIRVGTSIVFKPTRPDSTPLLIRCTSFLKPYSTGSNSSGIRRDASLKGPISRSPGVVTSTARHHGYTNSEVALLGGLLVRSDDTIVSLR